MREESPVRRAFSFVVVRDFREAARRGQAPGAGGARRDRCLRGPRYANAARCIRGWHANVARCIPDRRQSTQRPRISRGLAPIARRSVPVPDVLAEAKHSKQSITCNAGMPPQPQSCQSQKSLRRKIIYFALKFAKTRSSKRVPPMPECPQRKKFSQKTPKASRGATVTSNNSGLNVTEQRDGPK